MKLENFSGSDDFYQPGNLTVIYLFLLFFIPLVR